MTPPLIVDASVAVKWFVEEDDSDVAGALLSGDIVVHAPRLLATELANALWKNWRREKVSLQQARSALGAVRQIVGQWHDVEPLLDRAVQLSFELDHPVYDLTYLSLAEMLQLRCVTADHRLLGKVARTPYAAAFLPLSDFS